MERSAGYAELQVIPGVRARRAGLEGGGNGVAWGLLILEVFGVEAGVNAKWRVLQGTVGAWWVPGRAPSDHFSAYFHVFSILSDSFHVFPTYPRDFPFQSKVEVPPLGAEKTLKKEQTSFICGVPSRQKWKSQKQVQISTNIKQRSF